MACDQPVAEVSRLLTSSDALYLERVNRRWGRAEVLSSLEFAKNARIAKGGNAEDIRSSSGHCISLINHKASEFEPRNKQGKYGGETPPVGFIIRIARECSRH
ncbi:hypothetical protein CEXT_49901 [Caerostris extrusa]|uniref:Uncharacterized protein n=1 Tax=Caerostris extrusa TaxID=172846 RepID=A0AAV4XRU9_CAEEX|nr:hypothetical protein CEXT_49901 [Caerostris extrusa]